MAAPGLYASLASIPYAARWFPCVSVRSECRDDLGLRARLEES